MDKFLSFVSCILQWKDINVELWKLEYYEIKVRFPCLFPTHVRHVLVFSVRETHEDALLAAGTAIEISSKIVKMKVVSHNLYSKYIWSRKTHPICWTDFKILIGPTKYGFSLFSIGQQINDAISDLSLYSFYDIPIYLSFSIIVLSKWTISSMSTNCIDCASFFSHIFIY